MRDDLKAEIAQLCASSPPEPAKNEDSRDCFDEIFAHQNAFRVFVRSLLDSMGHTGPIEFSRFVTERASKDRNKSIEEKKKFLIDKLKPVAVSLVLLSAAFLASGRSFAEVIPPPTVTPPTETPPTVTPPTVKPANNFSDGEVHQSAPLVDEKRAEEFVDGLSDTSLERRTVSNTRKSEIKSILDLRIPQIVKSCSKDVALEITLQGYAFVADIPGGEVQLKRTVEKIERKQPPEMRLLTPDCANLLRAMSISVMRVYLGDEWGTNKESTQGDGPKQRGNP